MSSDPTIEQLTRWAESLPEVRSVILTSTRAVPDAVLDAYSDYDVILVVDAVLPMLEDTGWLTTFGEVLIAYWDRPEQQTATATATGEVAGVVNYENGLKIDFTLWSPQRLGEAIAGGEPELDAGHRVLVDKDHLTEELPPPTYRSYVPRRPDEGTYRRLITDFLIGVPYVAKSLLRDELLPAKWAMDVDMRFNHLVPLLEWLVECEHGWSVKTGALGRGLASQLPPGVAAELVLTFAGADTEQNWEALFAMVRLFGQVAQEVGEALGYPYPADLVAGVSQHAHLMREGAFADGPLAGR